MFIKKIIFINVISLAIIFMPIPAYAETQITITGLPFVAPFYSASQITTGSDGKLWVVTIGENDIIRMDTNGSINKFPIPTENSIPYDITKGPDGNVWFTELSSGSIGKITPNGTITEFNNIASNGLSGITSGLDGNLWFTDPSRNEVGYMSTNGNFTKFTIPSKNSLPYHITSGKNGDIWFAESGVNKIGKISSNGNITEYQSPSTDSSPYNLTSGSDGNIWYTKLGYYHDKIGKISPDGNITEYSLPYGDKHPGGITNGPDGNIWFTEISSNQIGRITPNGVITEWFVPNGQSSAMSISSGSDGNIWFTEYNGDIIGRVNLVPELVTPSPNPTPTSAPLTIKDYKQTDPQWGGARLDNSQNCGTMYNFGCAVTAVTDVFYSYGKTILNNNAQLDPGSLNNWLTTNNGYTGCSIIWGNAASGIGLGAPAIIFRNNTANWTIGQNAIDNALTQGNLPIIGITTSFGTHFIAISKKLADVNGKPNYSIVDPALYPFVSNSIGKTGQSLNQAYGGFDKVFEVVSYDKNSSSQKSLTIRAHSPVQLLITDPNGNQTGYDVSTKQITQNIPDSAYGIEPGIAPVDGSAPAMPETKYFQQINPSDGDYNVQLIGTGDGSYLLDVSETDDQGNVSTQVLKGFAKKGVTESFTTNYTSDATQTPVITKSVDFNVLKSDIKVLFSQKQIKTDIVYQTLLLQADLAQKATQLNRQPLGNKLAIIPLKTFLIELTKQRGKLVTEDAYQILNTDVSTLIKNLQGTTGGSGSSGGS